MYTSLGKACSPDPTKCAKRPYNHFILYCKLLYSTTCTTLLSRITYRSLFCGSRDFYSSVWLGCWTSVGGVSITLEHACGKRSIIANYFIVWPCIRTGIEYVGFLPQRRAIWKLFFRSTSVNNGRMRHGSPLGHAV